MMCHGHVPGKTLGIPGLNSVIFAEMICDFW